MDALTLRGVEFGPVAVASGTLNNFGEGWPYHEEIKKLPKVVSGRFDFARAVLVAKTATFPPNAGNMPLDENFQPIERLPRCIYADHLRQIALNAVSLSNPGIKALLDTGRWQALAENFWISFMAIGDTEEKQLEETEGFARAVKQARELTAFKAKFGVQLNVTCPNTQHDPKEQVNRAIGQGEVLRAVLGEDVPLDLKANAMVRIGTVKQIQKTRLFDALACSNTIPWAELPEWINWKKLFPSGQSPLRQRGFQQFGGLSGRPLLPIVERWIKDARADGVYLPITGGGGILCPDDAARIFRAGADRIAISSVAFLRFWNVRPIIERSYQIAERRHR